MAQVTFLSKSPPKAGISNTLKAKTLKGLALREYKQKITLDPTQREVIVGTLRTNRRRLASYAGQ